MGVVWGLVGCDGGVGLVCGVCGGLVGVGGDLITAVTDCDDACVYCLPRRGRKGGDGL